MKKIYIVLTYSGTMLARAIKLYTRKEYSHVSISLDRRLNNMYSFGRLNPYNPFWGGFVHESLDYGTFKRFKKTKSKIYAIDVKEDDYEKIKESIEKVNKDRYKYSFNITGLAAVMFNLRIKKDKSFYCAEFVKYLLDNTSMNLSLPDIIKPDDFQSITGGRVIYTGILQNYR